MVDKVKGLVDAVNQEVKKKVLVSDRVKTINKISEQRATIDRLVERQQEIEKEREDLRNLSDHELMAELVYAVRGFYSDVEKLKEEQAEANGRISELEKEVDSIREEIKELKGSSSSLSSIISSKLGK